MLDTEDFFKEVKKLIKPSEINEQSLKEFVDKPSSDNDDIWINTSLNSLIEAFQLMNMHGIHLDDVFRRLKKS